MPQGSKNPAQGNNLPAFLADIRTGWEEAPLTLKERRAVLLRFGMDLQVQEIAVIEGVAQPAISVRLFTSVGKITAAMNGTEFYEGEIKESDKD